MTILELSPAVRFVAQVIAALLMIFGAGVVLNDLGSMTPSGELLQLGFLAVPFTVFATLGIINALNMCDGLDGLSGSLTLTSLSGLILVAYIWGSPGRYGACCRFLGTAIVGFLLFNLRLLGRERASVFMGDAGSMFLGFALTWYAISLSQGESRALPPVGGTVVPDDSDFRCRVDDAPADTEGAFAVRGGPRASAPRVPAGWIFGQ